MSDLTRWEPFEGGLTLRQAMDRFMDEIFWRGWMRPENGMQSIAMDVREEDDKLVVECALPGVKPEDVDVTISGDTLSIQGEVEHAKEEVKGKYHFRERRYGTYRRTFTLPTGVDADAAKATFENGVLTLVLPKAETAKAKHIPVKT